MTTASDPKQVYIYIYILKYTVKNVKNMFLRIWGLGAPRQRKNTLTERGNIFHYRQLHSENFHFSMFLLSLFDVFFAPKLIGLILWIHTMDSYYGFILGIHTRDSYYGFIRGLSHVISQKWCHSRTECKSSLKMLILLCVFEGHITVDCYLQQLSSPAARTG